MAPQKRKEKSEQHMERLFHNTQPLNVPEFDFVKWHCAFELTSFPLVNDFAIKVRQTETLGFHLYFHSDQMGYLASFPWWDNVEKDLPNFTLSRIPAGTLEAPFNECEQSWQIIIFKQDDHVYIMQGQEPGCPNFSTWFRVASKRYYDEWRKVINKFKPS